MKKETVPPIKLNDQSAIDYTLYMMLTGCFKKTTCLSPVIENQLLFHYRSQDPKVQSVIETICMAVTDKYLPQELPKEIWEYMVEIHLRKGQDDNPTTILIDGSFFSFEVSAKISGARRVLVTYKYQDEDGASLSNRVTVRLRSPRHGSPTVSLEYDEA